MGNYWCCGLHNKSSYSSSSMVWAAGEDDDDDEWVSVADCVSKNASVPSKNNKSNCIPVEKQSLLGLCPVDHDDPNVQASSSASDDSSSSHSCHRREQVKIKISKKELEELLRRGRGDDDDVHSNMISMSIPLDQLLSRLLKLQSDREDQMNHIHHHFDQRSAWRPILQTIPELN